MAKFIRTKNRDIDDIFRNMIAPRAKALLQNTAQNWVTFCRNNHTWKNRTGALENSISWTEVKKTPTGFKTTIEAGGLSEAKYAYDFALRAGLGLRLRNQRFLVGSLRAGSEMFAKVSPGDQIYVDYAMYVENKGYPVLKQGEEYIRAKGVNVKIMELPNG